MSGPRSRWKLPSELTQDEVDEALYSLERGYGLISSAESYLRSTAACRIDFWLGWRHQPRTHHFEAQFQRLAETDQNYIGTRGTRLISDAEASGEVDLLRHEENWFGHTVFIVIGEVAKEGERVDVIALPRIESTIYSTVRLESLKEAPVFWPEEGFASLPRNLPSRERIGNRKRDPLRITWFSGRSNDSGELPGQLIKRRVKILTNVRDGVGEVFGEVPDGRHAFNAEDVVSRLRVQIGANYCLVHWVSEGLKDVVFEIDQVSMPPTKLPYRITE